MTDRAHAAITLATALVLGASAYGHAFDLNLPGALGDIWSSGYWNLTIYGLAILGVFFVYRWWALLPAIAPVAVPVYLYNMTDYVPPWQGESLGLPSRLSEQPGLYVLLVIIAIVLQLVFLSVGLLLRAVRERVRSRHREGALPDSA